MGGGEVRRESWRVINSVKDLASSGRDAAKETVSEFRDAVTGLFK